MKASVVVSALCLIVIWAGNTQTDHSTLSVSGVKVVFFGPTEAERDSIAREEGYEIDDVLDDFNYCSGKAAVYLTDRKIPVEFTTSPMIVIQVRNKVFRTFDRRLVPELVGMILSDGVHEPRLVRGGGTDRELIAEIDDFFHLQ